MNRPAWRQLPFRALLAQPLDLSSRMGTKWRAVTPPGGDITPFDIDLHTIPANSTKGEPEHWHADVRFAFWVGNPQISLQHDEVTAWKWRPRTDAPTPTLAAKLATL